MLGFFLLPNQGSNLDFTDPESVVLPITPLGKHYSCKNTHFLNAANRMWKNFFGFFTGLSSDTYNQLIFNTY